jgi:hypothetical protein
MRSCWTEDVRRSCSDAKAAGVRLQGISAVSNRVTRSEAAALIVGNFVAEPPITNVDVSVGQVVEEEPHPLLFERQASIRIAITPNPLAPLHASYLVRNSGHDA